MGALLSMVGPILGPILLRYAVTVVGSGVASLSAYLMAKYGLSAETVAGLGTGVVGVGAALYRAVQRNKSAAAVVNRLPVIDMLHAVANATGAKVVEIQVADHRLADAVPSPKVVPAEGQTQAQV